LRAAVPDKKLLPTSGVRLGAARDLTDTHPHLFRSAQKTAKLLDELRPFQDLRSILAHSTLLKPFAREGPPLYVFDPADRHEDFPWINRLVLRGDEFTPIMRKVSDLTNQLAQQVP
jgi:hypothetical protein